MSDDPKMAYIEFQTTIKNGMIEIPAAYRERLPQQVRVILLSEEAPPAKGKRPSIQEVLAESPGQRVFKTAAAVEQYLQEEHSTWDH